MLIPESPVEGGRISHDFNRGVEQRRAGGEVDVGLLELSGDGRPARCDVVESLANLDRRSRSFSDEVEEILLLRFEASEFAFQLGVLQLTGEQLSIDAFTNRLADTLDETFVESPGRQMALDGIFDVLNQSMRCGAPTELAPSTEEVEVFASIADGPRNHQAMLESLPTACLTPQASLQVVMVDSITFASGALAVEHLLDLVEQHLIDERFMATGEFLALMSHVSEVVPIPQ